MRKKIIVEASVPEEVAEEEVEVEEAKDLVSEDFGREDLNKLARKVNELIKRCL